MSALVYVRGFGAIVLFGAITVGCLQVNVRDPHPAPTPLIDAPARDARYDKPGFYTELDASDGRLWVLKEGSDGLAHFRKDGKRLRHVVRPGAGPDGLALKSTASATIIEYVATKPGFRVFFDSRDEGIWVFAEGSEDLEAFGKDRPAQPVVRPGAGPMGLMLKSSDADTIVSYVASKPGFHTQLDSRDGRLWVFAEGSEDHAKFKAEGRPARHVVRPGAGPLGLTIKSTRNEVLDAYQAVQ
jgi:hypothetical protein